MQKVYLAGAINGKSDAKCRKWMEKATGALCGEFFVLDPMRRDYRGKEAGNERDIVMADLFDIKAAHIVLANLKSPSWGTAMEIAHARIHQIRKLIVGFGAPRRPSPWLVYHCDKLFRSLDDAILFLRGPA